MVLRYPFVGRLGIQISFVPVNDSRIHTIATNGKVIYIRPEWVCSMPPATMLSLIAHTVWTAALCHSFRRDERNVKKFDLASDLEVYTLLKVENVPRTRKPDFFEKFPKHLSVEKIYDELPDIKYSRCGDCDVHLYSAGKVSLPELPVEGEEEKNEETEKAKNNNNSSKSDDSEENGENSGKNGGKEAKSVKSESENGNEYEFQEADCECDPAVKEVWRQRIIEAGQNYKMTYGQLPGELQELVEYFSRSKTDYLQILRRYLTLCSGGESSWLPPARRFVWQKNYLPSHRNPKLKIVAAIDTSGSISEENFRDFLGEISAAVQNFPDYELTVIQCDEDVRHVEKFSREKPFDKNRSFTVYGRGGTDFQAVFDYVKREKLDPKVLIYYTDGAAAFPENPRSYPVIWALTKEKDVPWGKKIVLPDGSK